MQALQSRWILGVHRDIRDSFTRVPERVLMATSKVQLPLFAAITAGLLLSPINLPAQTGATQERFRAFAVNMDSTVGRTGAQSVEIVVDRWSTEAEASRLLETLQTQGPQKLLDALQAIPRLGYIRTPDTIGYELHFARKTPAEDGGEHIVIATDRYISFWEARNQPRSIDYPFTVIEIHMNGDGTGEGKMSIATKVTTDKKRGTIILENYGTQPVRLNQVRRETKSP